MTPTKSQFNIIHLAWLHQTTNLHSLFPLGSPGFLGRNLPVLGKQFCVIARRELFQLYQEITEI